MDAIALRKVCAGRRHRSSALITIPDGPHVLRYIDIRRGVLLIANYSPLASNLDQKLRKSLANTQSRDDEI